MIIHRVVQATARAFMLAFVLDLIGDGVIWGHGADACGPVDPDYSGILVRALSNSGVSDDGDEP
jgi:hypothetical protein